MDLALFSDCVNEGRYETTTLIDMTALQRRTRTDESPSGQQVNNACGTVSQTVQYMYLASEAVIEAEVMLCVVVP